MSDKFYDSIYAASGFVVWIQLHRLDMGAMEFLCELQSYKSTNCGWRLPPSPALIDCTSWSHQYAWEPFTNINFPMFLWVLIKRCAPLEILFIIYPSVTCQRLSYDLPAYYRMVIQGPSDCNKCVFLFLSWVRLTNLILKKDNYEQDALRLTFIEPLSSVGPQFDFEYHISQARFLSTGWKTNSCQRICTVLIK